MSVKYKFHNPAGVYFISFAVEGWVDVFTRSIYKDIIVDSLNHCVRQKGLELFAWCLMTNHLHLMARAREGTELPDILRDFKKFTSKSVLQAIESNSQESRKEWLLTRFRREKGNRFWRGDNHSIELWSNDVLKQKLDYIHANPVEEGIVFRPEDYLYGSGPDYSGQKGLVEVVLIG